MKGALEAQCLTLRLGLNRENVAAACNRSIGPSGYQLRILASITIMDKLAQDIAGMT
ncbi:MAG: hypothetical protein JO166_08015 [Deltaproteobacteria bacterium]|nr:hypothetical protein [Deltaproteobacteria bacterium]